MSALTIVGAADHAGYCTFASALRNTEFIAALEGTGPFTVFAPNDAAFEKLSKAVKDRLLDGDRDLLRLVIGYHIAAGKVVNAQLTGRRIRAVMHAGGDVLIDGRTHMRVNGARVVEPDVAAANGVIHGIDAVLWPRTPAEAVGVA